MVPPCSEVQLPGTAGNGTAAGAGPPLSGSRVAMATPLGKPAAADHKGKWRVLVPILEQTKCDQL